MKDREGGTTGSRARSRSGSWSASESSDRQGKRGRRSNSSESSKEDRKRAKRAKKERKKEKKEKKKEKKKESKRLRRDKGKDEVKDGEGEPAAVAAPATEMPDKSGAATTEVPDKTNKRDFFARLRAEEAQKGPVGTLHATGKTESEVLEEVEKKTNQWICVKCGRSNYKGTSSCDGCKAMKRLGT